MKRLLLLIGLGLIIWGILGLNELKRQRSLIPERPGYGIPEEKRESLAKDNTIATALIVVGGLLFLIGLIPSLKPKQAAQAVTKETASAPAVAQVTAVPENTGSDKIAQLERLAKLKEQGVLSEEEFQKEKSKILG